jgi:2-dehydropantoate 2-reductase
VKVAVVGAGAMGSIYAGLLGAAGNEVWAIDVWTEHVEAIERGGLWVSGPDGDRSVRIRAVTDADVVGEADLVVIATKSYDVASAAAAALGLVGPETIVLPIQNGLGSVETVADAYGPDNVIVGVVGGWGASVVAPGHVHHHGSGSLRLGELHGPVTPRLERLADVWRSAGFTVLTYDDIDRLVWEKLICNVAFSGPCAMLGRTIGDVVDEPNAWLVASACAQEAYAVAVAGGVGLTFDDPVRYVAEFAARIRGARPSMLLDVMAGKRCEIDVINGAIPPRALSLGLRAPFNESVSALVRAKEAFLLGPDGRATERPRGAGAVSGQAR